MPKPKKKKQTTSKTTKKKETAKSPAKKKTAKKRSTASKKIVSKIAKASSISKKSLPKRKTTSKRGRKKKPVIKVNRTPIVLGILLVIAIGALIYKVPQTGLYKRVFQKTPTRKEYVYKPSYEAKPVRKAKAKPKPRRVAPTRKPTSQGPKIVFVIDDIGNTSKNQKLLENLGNEVTYAVLPLLPYSRHFASLSKKTGAELILHLPIEPSGGVNPGPGMLRPSMSRNEIVRQFKENMKSVPNVKGMNNHTGSLGTADERLMGIVLSEVKSNNLFFLDSYTTPNSVVLEVSKEKGVSALRRDVFLDNVDEQEAIKKQIERLATTAKEHGSAIGICHYRYNTLKVLNEEIPRLKKQGYRIVSLEDLIGS